MTTPFLLGVNLAGAEFGNGDVKMDTKIRTQSRGFSERTIPTQRMPRSIITRP